MCGIRDDRRVLLCRGDARSKLCQPPLNRVSTIQLARACSTGVGGLRSEGLSARHRDAGILNQSRDELGEFMIGIGANKFHHGTTFLAALETSLGAFKWAADTEGLGKINAKFEMAAIEPEMDAVVETLNQIGLQDCALELTRAKNALRRHLAGQLDDPRPLFDSYRRRVHDALKKVTFLAVSETERNMIQPAVPLFGLDVDKAFPSAAEDIAEAAKALTFTLFTAAVFHCMRCSEAALRCLATALGVIHQNQNWGTIIQDVEFAISSMNATSHGKDWKQLRQFYSEAATHFRMLKDAWRNYVMHSHVTYTSQQALDIYNATRSLMQQVSTKLHE